MKSRVYLKYFVHDCIFNERSSYVVILDLPEFNFVRNWIEQKKFVRIFISVIAKESSSSVSRWIVLFHRVAISSTLSHKHLINTYFLSKYSGYKVFFPFSILTLPFKRFCLIFGIIFFLSVKFLMLFFKYFRFHPNTFSLCFLTFLLLRIYVPLITSIYFNLYLNACISLRFFSLLFCFLASSFKNFVRRDKQRWSFLQ